MKLFRNRAAAKRQWGASMVDMALLVALISILSITGVKAVGKEAKCVFKKANSAISSGYADSLTCCEGLSVCSLQPFSCFCVPGDPLGMPTLLPPPANSGYL